MNLGRFVVSGLCIGPGYLRAGTGRALRVDPEALGLKLSSLTGYKLPGIGFYRRILCEKKKQDKLLAA